jgi:hypothetical protein
MIAALQKRVKHLSETVAIQKLTFDRLLSDLEMTESVGCGYAWDLSASEWKWVKTETGYDLHSCPADRGALFREWQAALAAGEAYQEAKKWLRDRMRTDLVWRKTAIEAAGKNPDMLIETPHGSYSLRLLSAT